MDGMERMDGRLLNVLFLTFYVLLLSLLKIGYPGCPFSLFFFLQLRLVVIERLFVKIIGLFVCACVSSRCACGLVEGVFRMGL